MSRTVRRKNVRLPKWEITEIIRNDDVDLTKFEHIQIWYPGRPFIVYYKGYYKKDTKEYKKAKAKFYTDVGTNSFREPGPMWFIREFSQAPYRARAKNELANYKKYTDYEVVLESKPKLRYWT